jgi:hypothetical protein
MLLAFFSLDLRAQSVNHDPSETGEEITVGNGRLRRSSIAARRVHPLRESALALGRAASIGNRRDRVPTSGQCDPAARILSAITSDKDERSLNARISAKRRHVVSRGTTVGYVDVRSSLVEDTSGA